MTTIRRFRHFLLSVYLLLAIFQPCIAVEREHKVILDTDMSQMRDDAYTLFMMANSPEVELLGVTTCAGNLWGEDAVAYSLRYMEMLGRPTIPVYRGISEPIMGLRGSRLDAEEKHYGKALYIGAYGEPRPESYLKIAKPPYGGNPTTKPAAGDAVDFIVEQVKKNPHEVTLLMIGPPQIWQLPCVSTLRLCRW